MVGLFISILQFEGSNFTNGVFLVYSGKFIEYFFM